MPKAKSLKTIGVTVRFCTNDLEVIAEGKPRIACWDRGFVTVEANEEKGIHSQPAIPFNSSDEIMPIVKECLKKAHVMTASWGKSR